MGRRLTPGETRLARQVFGTAVACSRVRIGGGGFGRFAVTLGSRLCLPSYLRSADFSLAQPALQGLFVHELTHVWQFQTRPLGTLISWARVLLSGGYGYGMPGYRYPLPFGDFRKLNLEQQASVVEHAFLLRQGRRTGLMPAAASVADYAAAPFPLAVTHTGPWDS